LEARSATQDLDERQAQRLAKEGKVDVALREYEELQSSDPLMIISSQAWNDLCWFGSIYGKAEEVFFAGDIALAFRTDDGNFHDTRGVALAMSGKTKEAIQDFEAYLWWTRLHERRTERQQWIRDLKSGKPVDEIFTAKVIERLSTQ